VRKEAADWRRRRQALRVAKRVKVTASTASTSNNSSAGVNFLMAAAYMYAHRFSRGASITGTQPKLLALSRSWHRRADACSLPRVAPVCGSSSTFACACDDLAIVMVRFVALAVQRRVKNGALPKCSGDARSQASDGAAHVELRRTAQVRDISACRTDCPPSCARTAWHRPLCHLALTPLVVFYAVVVRAQPRRAQRDDALPPEKPLVD
jgi:hypothetical protein